MNKQLSLFGKEEQIGIIKKPVKLKGGSQNPIVFRDYESFVAKFSAREKTTDDTYTPKDVYEAVVEYVGSQYDLTDKVILRPFYPGGDYENAEYPDNGVVIDNPPFSIFTKICKFYTARRIPFFLFGPGLVIGSVFDFCTAVVINSGIKFSNGAEVKCNFATNLFDDTVVMTAPELDDALERCESQDDRVNLPKYEYSKNLLSISDLQTIARGGIHFSVSREECMVVKNLDNMPKGKSLFGNHLLVSEAKAKAKAEHKIIIHLSEREKRIIKTYD